MSAASSLLLCGDSFGEAQRAALATHRSRLRIVDTPIPNDATQMPDGVDAIWIGAGSADAGRLAATALREGRAVLCDAGLTQQELAECVRLVRGHGAPLRFGAATARLPAVRQLSAATRLLRPRLRAIHAECDPLRLPALIETLGTALGRLRPWRLQATSIDDGTQRIHGEIAGVPLRLHVRDAVGHLRLTLDSIDGELRLIDAHGPLRWTPRGVDLPLDLGDHAPADPLADWARAIGADLQDLLDALETPATPLPADLAQRLALAQLLQELRTVLGCDAGDALVAEDLSGNRI
ncbi:MAG: hypothetical protein ACREP7_18680, partial [Lysobacter sp.]